MREETEDRVLLWERRLAEADEARLGEETLVPLVAMTDDGHGEARLFARGRYDECRGRDADCDRDDLEVEEYDDFGAPNE